MTTAVPTPDPADEGDGLAGEVCGRCWNHSGGVGQHNARKYGPCSDHAEAADVVLNILGYVSPDRAAAAVRAAKAKGIEEGRGDMAHWEARWKAEALRDAAARIRLGLDTSNHIGQGAEMACKQLDDLAARADTIAT